MDFIEPFILTHTMGSSSNFNLILFSISSSSLVLCLLLLDVLVQLFQKLVVDGHQFVGKA